MKDFLTSTIGLALGLLTLAACSLGPIGKPGEEAPPAPEGETTSDTSTWPQFAITLEKPNSDGVKVATYRISRQSGALSLVETKDGGVGRPGFSALSPDGKFYYVPITRFDNVTRKFSSHVGIWSIDKQSGKLTAREQTETIEGQLAYSAITPDGRFFLVAGYDDEEKTTFWNFPRDRATGELMAPVVSPIPSTSSIATGRLEISRDNTRVILSVNTSALSFSLNRLSGEIRHQATTVGRSSNDIRISDDGKSAVLTDYTFSSVLRCAVNSRFGYFENCTPPLRIPSNHSFSDYPLTLSPSQKSFYTIASKGVPGGPVEGGVILQYGLEKAGELPLVRSVETKPLKRPRCLSMPKKTRVAYVSSVEDSEIYIYSIDAKTEQLAFRGTTSSGMGAPTCFEFIY